MLACVPAQATDLYVYVPTALKAKAVENILARACPTLSWTVFGRARDFHAQVAQATPGAVISLDPAIDAAGSYDRVASGMLGGESTEEYLLVTAGAPLSVAALDGKRLGVMEIMGRKDMNRFVQDSLKRKVSLQRVTKIDDLLPLLLFETVDGLFVSRSTFNYLKKTSELSLSATSTGVKAGLSALASGKQVPHAEMTACVTRFSGEINAVFGVDTWVKK